MSHDDGDVGANDRASSNESYEVQRPTENSSNPSHSSDESHHPATTTTTREDVGNLSDISDSSVNDDDDGRPDEANVSEGVAVVDTTFLEREVPHHPGPSSDSDAATEVGEVLDRLERQLSVAFVINRTSRVSSNLSQSSDQANGHDQSNQPPQPIQPLPNLRYRPDQPVTPQQQQQPRLGDWLRLRPRSNLHNNFQFQQYNDQSYQLPQRPFRNAPTDPLPVSWGEGIWSGSVDPAEYQQHWEHGFLGRSPGVAIGYMHGPDPNSFQSHVIQDIQGDTEALNLQHLDDYEADVEDGFHAHPQPQECSSGFAMRPIDADDDDARTPQPTRSIPPPVVHSGTGLRPLRSPPNFSANTDSHPQHIKSSSKGSAQENCDKCRGEESKASPTTTTADIPKQNKPLEAPFEDNLPEGDPPISNDPYDASFLHFDLHNASSDSKFETYACQVDKKQSDRSIEIALFSFARPHMRGFHFAWIGFFVAFFTWFAISPLLPEVKESLGLTKEEIWTSSICGVAGTVIFRIVAGPICDKYGARWVMGCTLFISGLPTMATGLVNTAVGLSALRLVIGIAGSAFVTCQYWTSTMFTMEVAGTANSLAAGWGNLGGGVTQIVMGSVLFPAFKWLYGETDHSDNNNDTADRAWRTVCIIPGLISMITAFFIVMFSDDSPKGNYRKLKKLGLMPSISAKKSLQAAAHDFNTWLLFVQYGACFGVELTVSNAAALYFNEEFGQSTESAAAIASVFGWMNLFARGLGGFGSDIMNVYLDMRGRLIFQLLSLVLEGVLIIFFASASSLGSAILAMACFSLFVQISEGSTFAIVPYVNPPVTGSIAGLIGAGGNAGGVAFALIFWALDYRKAFYLMGWAVVSTSVLSVFISIKGHAGLVCGRNAPEVIERHSGHKTNITEQLSCETTTQKVPDQKTQPTSS